MRVLCVWLSRHWYSTGCKKKEGEKEKEKDNCTHQLSTHHPHPTPPHPLQSHPPPPIGSARFIWSATPLWASVLLDGGRLPAIMWGGWQNRPWGLCRYLDLFASPCLQRGFYVYHWLKQQQCLCHFLFIYFFNQVNSTLLSAGVFLKGKGVLMTFLFMCSFGDVVFVL